jgi:two-component system, LytTR family, response regulator
MKAIIVDDEQSARMTLRTILDQFFPEVTVVGEADSPKAAVALIEAKQPDLVFLDIQMHSGSGFEVLESLEKINFQVIFVSAHKQHAFDSFRFNATDYLLKPLRIKDLRSALEKVKDNMRIVPAAPANALIRQTAQDQFKTQLVVSEPDGFSVLQLSDIVRCEASRNYTHFFMLDKRTEIASKNIKDFDDLLLPHGFARIHKSHIINLSHLVKYVKGRGGEVMMRDGMVLPVSREKRDAFVELFLR